VPSQGKTIKTAKNATGKLKMGLQLDSPPLPTSQPAVDSVPKQDGVAAAAPRAAPAAPPSPPAAPPAPPAAPASNTVPGNTVGDIPLSQPGTATKPLPGGGQADVGLIISTAMGPGGQLTVQSLAPGGPAASSGQVISSLKPTRSPETFALFPDPQMLDPPQTLESGP
jgi:hypothetical protein